MHHYNDCEFCARHIIYPQVAVNGYEFHTKCFHTLSPKQQQDCVARYMAMPHPKDPAYTEKLDKLSAFALKNKLGIFGERDMTPAEIAMATA